ncbi:MAG: hypothetical protein MZW92_24620 [Comamonadaceae bacterium]|nr:hypothetical protein [Comamonadaceae bacterium]
MSDRGPSLAVRELDDGALRHRLRRLQRAGSRRVGRPRHGRPVPAKCDPRPGHGTQRERRPFVAADLIDLAAFEAGAALANRVVADLAAGRAGDVDRLIEAAARLGNVAEVVHGRRRRASPGGASPTGRGQAAADDVRQLLYTLASELPDDAEEFDDELVEGVIGRKRDGGPVRGQQQRQDLPGDRASGLPEPAGALPRAQHGRRRGAVPRPPRPRSRSSGASGLARKHHGGGPAGRRHRPVADQPVRRPADVTAVLSLVDEVESLLGEKVALDHRRHPGAHRSRREREQPARTWGWFSRNADAIRSGTGSRSSGSTTAARTRPRACAAGPGSWPRSTPRSR